MRSFTINQTIHSEKGLGLRVTKPPAIPSSQQVVDHLEALGREGTLTRLQGWEDQELSFQVALQGQNLTSQYRAATAALVSALTVELSASPGLFYHVKNTVVSGL